MTIPYARLAHPTMSSPTPATYAEVVAAAISPPTPLAAMVIHDARPRPTRRTSAAALWPPASAPAARVSVNTPNHASLTPSTSRVHRTLVAFTIAAAKKTAIISVSSNRCSRWLRT
jgi:hypothetical protein